MENVNHADESQLNIQNDYFNNARKNRMRVTVVLMTGQRISGLIRSFDRFTLILDTRHGDQMVFKHAIATVAPAFAGERDLRGRPPRGQERGEGRPPGGPPHRTAPPHSRDGSGPAGPQRPETRPRGASGPQGKSFGNFMDLSAVTGAPEKASPPKDSERTGGAEAGRPVADTKPAVAESGASPVKPEPKGGAGKPEGVAGEAPPDVPKAPDPSEG